MIKKLLVAGLIASAASAPVSAATFLTVVNSSPATCTTFTPVCNFDVDGEVDTDGAFSLVSNTFLFPRFGESTGSLTNSRARFTATLGTNIDFAFDQVFLRNTGDGSTYLFDVSNGSVVSNAALDAIVTSGLYELVINGTAQTYTGSPAPSYPRIGGDITFVANAVPEPATWALFILGFGAIGHTMRRRSSKVRVAKAALTFA